MAPFEYRHITDEPADAWLSQHFPTGGRLGYDPWLHTADGLISIREAVKRRGGQLVPCERNPSNTVFKTTRPAPPIAPVVVHRSNIPAARRQRTKRGRDRGQLEKAGIDAAVISQPASIAWLLNVRGG